MCINRQSRSWPKTMIVMPLAIRFSATALLMLIFSATQVDARQRVLVLSASSAAPAVTEIASEFTQKTGLEVRVANGSSGTLARQIQRGAPADVYISASGEWIDILTRERRLEPRFSRPLLRNRLVMVSPKSGPSRPMLDLSRPVLLLDRLGSGRLAIGDPAHVPAGEYAKQALENLGLWPAVRDRLARQTNVRAVLALVERGEAPLGIVYATDFALSSSVKITAIVPAHSHDPITYGVAILTESARPEVIQFYNALADEEAGEIFTRFGFGLIQGSANNQLSNMIPSKP